MSNPIKIAIIDPKSEDQEHFSIAIKEKLEDEQSIYAKPSKIMVISGSKGNLRALRRTLFKFTVIDSKDHWIWDDGHLVILGNCIEEGDKSMECLWFIYNLENKALRKGGKVHFLLGEQELLRMQEKWPQNPPRYAYEKVFKSTYAVLYDGNNELKRWLRTKNIIEMIGNTLLTAIGIPPAINTPFATLSYINSNIRAHFKKGSDPLDLTGSTDTISDFTKDHRKSILKNFEADILISSFMNYADTELLSHAKFINIASKHGEINPESIIFVRNAVFHVYSSGNKTRLK